MPVIFMERSLLDSLTEADIKEIIDENEGHTKYAQAGGILRGQTTTSSGTGRRIAPPQ